MVPTRPKLEVLPAADASAAENMAQDLAMLAELISGGARLRFYGWNEPCTTFGYSQRWTDARQEAALLGLPDGAPLIRRPTGGGVVDHRADLTYALALSGDHPAARMRAPAFYRVLHQSWQDILGEVGIASVLAPCPRLCDAPLTASAVCFRDFAADDVLTPDGVTKIAGAALKRTRQGLLVQGSLAVAANLHDALTQRAPGQMARWLDLELVSRSRLPSAPTEEPDFASEAWNRRR